MTLLRRFRDTATGSYSYLLTATATGQAILIDPVVEQVPLYLGVLAELDCSLVCVFDTHVHADHRTAAATLRELTGAAVAASAAAGVVGLDLVLEDGGVVNFGDQTLHVIATPGHSDHCLTYRWEDRLFTGDTLLADASGTTHEPGANPGVLYDSISRRLLTLPDETLIYPGHGDGSRWVSCIGEMRAAEPWLSGVSRDEFIARARERTVFQIPGMAANLMANRRCGEMLSDGQ